MSAAFHAARVAATVLIAVSASACGGGGGGSAAGTPPMPPPISDRAAARADAQALLAAAKVFAPRGVMSGSAPIGVFSGARRPAASLRPQAVQCAPGTSPSTSSSTAWTTSPGGIMTRTVTDYYDASCAQPELVSAILVATGTDPNGPLTHGQGLVTAYDRSGAVLMYSQLYSDSDPTSITVQTNDAPHPDGSGTTGETTIGCTIAQSGASESCSIASRTSAGLSSVGVAGTIIASTAPNGSMTRTTTQISENTYTGPVYVTGVRPGPYSISGGTQLSTLTGTALADFNGTVMNDSDYEVSDAVTGVSVHGTLVGPGIAATLSRAGTAIATISTDADGIGTIRYADGSTETIVGFSIFG